MGAVNNPVMVVFPLLLICMTVDVNGGNERKNVAIRGVVYCLDCAPNNRSELVPIQTPVAGALLKLRCNNTIRKPWEQEIKTNSKGKFVLKTEKVTSWGIHKCNLFLLSSPQLNCSSTGNPYPEPDGTPWIFGRRLKPVKPLLNASSDFQFYAADSPLLFYPHWSPCT